MIALDTPATSEPRSQRFQSVHWYVIILIIGVYGVSIGSQLGQPIVGDEIRYLDYARNLLNGSGAFVDSYASSSRC
ncbi:hypothetical protein [Candidatus Entotheonella palauensis]|uniref:hypothetical protein n=1 Tax=Candidatus Entotheonella palauensis TaxID=93172 RepID=UPI0015C44DDC|nr:hypothetical protein [Candidatus Entotheonella palauensis]